MKAGRLITPLLLSSLALNACTTSVSFGAPLDSDKVPTPIPEKLNLDPQLVWDMSCVGMLEGDFNLRNIMILDPLIYFVGNDGYVPTINESSSPVIPEKAWLIIDSSGPSINYKYKNPETGQIESNSIVKDTQLSTPYTEKLITPSGEIWYLWVIGDPFYEQFIINPEGPCAEEVDA